MISSTMGYAISKRRRNRILGLIACWSLALSAQATVQAQYAHTIGGVRNDEGLGIGVDAAGNAYVVGEFRGTVDFDPSIGQALLTSTQQDVFVVSFDAAGDFRFAFQIGNGFATSESAGGIAVDDEGNFVVTGSQPFGTIDYDPDPNSVENRTGKLFIAGYDSDGRFRFAVTPEGTGAAASGKGNAVALDRAGNVYVTGPFVDTLLFNPGEADVDSVILTSAGSSDIFFASYTPTGVHRFAHRIGGTGDDVGYGIAVDGAGNVYVAGSFRDVVAFDPEETDGNGDMEERAAIGGSSDSFLAAYTEAGEYRFVHALGGSAGDVGYAVAVDAMDNVYLTGQISGSVAFDPDDTDGNGDAEERSSSANGGCFVASYTSEGVFRYASVPSGGTSAGRDVATDASGASFVTGSFGGSIDFSSGISTDTLSSESGTDIFVVGYNTEGGFRNAYVLSGNHVANGNGIAINHSQDIVLTGGFYGTTDFDAGPGADERTSTGDGDVFVATYPAALLVSSERLPPERPNRYELSRAYPNPFHEQTRFTVAVSESQHVRIAAHDVLGRRSALIYDAVLSAGKPHQFTFDATPYPAGMYLIQIVGARFRETLQVLHVR